MGSHSYLTFHMGLGLGLGWDSGSSTPAISKMYVSRIPIAHYMDTSACMLRTESWQKEKSLMHIYYINSINERQSRTSRQLHPVHAEASELGARVLRMDMD